MDDATASTSALIGAILGGEAGLRRAISEALALIDVSAPGQAPPDAAAGGLGGGVLVLIAEAGAAPGIAGTTPEAFADQVGGALAAVFRDLRQGVPALRKRGGGSVVIVAPPAAGQRSFDALRQGLRLLAKSAALELGPEGIRVNIVLPDAGDNPLGRPLSMADIAGAVAFAASPRARFMTGADLVVDGGRLAR